jgi:hypothetical protein
LPILFLLALPSPCQRADAEATLTRAKNILSTFSEIPESPTFMDEEASEFSLGPEFRGNFGEIIPEVRKRVEIKV